MSTEEDRCDHRWHDAPHRFIPFGHVRPIDDWEAELVRITQEFGWAGLKLHQGELRERSAGALAAARSIVEKAVPLGIRLVKIHLWAGANKVTFASDGYLYSVLVEKAKIETLRLPTPFRTPLLTDAEYGLIMGGTMQRLLGL